MLSSKQGRWSWVRRVRNCAPNVWAMIRENVDFVHLIFGPYFVYCAPNIRLLPLPLVNTKYIKLKFQLFWQTNKT